MDKEVWRSIFSCNLRRLCSEKGLTYADLAKFCGLPKSTVWNYTHAKAMPDIMVSAKIAEILGVSIDELVDYKTPYNLNGKFFNEGDDIYEQLE